MGIEPDDVTEPAAPPGAAERVRAALVALERLSLVHDRSDLAATAGGAARRVAGDRVSVVVCGEYKRGKSSLINALIDAPACAVDDDIATAARIEIGFADPAGAKRWYRSVDTDEILTVDIDPDDAAAASTDPATTLVRIGIPRRLLRSGLVLVDTPGVGGIGSAASMVTASSLAEAHGALFVTDASQELTRAEADALVDICRRCAHVVLVVTKIDITPSWRDVLAADRRHLERLGLSIPIVTVSSRLRRLALRAESTEINKESGFPELLRLIDERFLGSARARTVADALDTARRVYAHLREPLVAELDVLESDDAIAEQQAIEDARLEIDAFRSQVDGWQQVLSDGITDLTAAVDVDLRSRFRLLVNEADAELDAADPDAMWHEFEPALYRRTAESLDANLTLLRERADALAQRLAAAIADEEHEMLELSAGLAADVLAATAERRGTETTSSGVRAQQAFRAGYGGAMPIMAVGGMALGVLGLGTLVLPLAAVAGVMAGRKALTDERERRLGQRRQQAKLAVKKYADETMFRAAAERKQAQRHVHRTLRDHFTRRVRELASTRQQTFERARAAAAADERSRGVRIDDVRAELGRIEDVARQMAASA